MRPWREEDRASLPALLGDPEVMAFSDTGPLSTAEQATWLARAVSRSEGLPLTLAIDLDGEAVGYVSLANDETRVDAGEVELGFRLARRLCGQGYATYAAREVLPFAQDLRVVAMVDPHNCASVAVLRKLGMAKTREVMLPGYDYPDHLYALTP